MSEILNSYKRKRKWKENDILLFFELVCANNFFRGLTDSKLDVEFNRESFEILKNAIKKI